MIRKYIVVALLAWAPFHATAQSDAAAGAVGDTKASAGFEADAGRHNIGKVSINGRAYDADELVPSGDNAGYVDRLKQIDGAGDLESLRSAYDELKPQIDKDPSSWAEATRTSTATPKELARIENETNHDGEFWQQQINALQRPESVAGDMLTECTTKTVVTPASKDLSYTEERYCDLVNIPEEKQTEEICQRQAEYSETPTSDRKEKVSKLFVTEEGNGTICKRETRAENYRDTLAGMITSTIDITEEVGGLSCRREIIPESTSVDVTGTKSAVIPIDTQMPADGCSRTVTKSVVEESINNYIDFTASINNEEGGWLCSRSRVVTGGGSTQRSGQYETYFQVNGPGQQTTWNESLAAQLPAGTTSVTVTAGVFDPPNGGNDWPTECNYAQVLVQPSAANGWVITFKGETNWNSNPYNISCERGGQGAAVQVSWTATVAGAKQFSVSDNGNCAQNGTQHCPATWQCTKSAPTTINGISVSAADVSGLGALFPGASSTCVAADRVKVCSGSADTTNEISIAHLVPAGTKQLFDVNVSFLSNPSAATAAVTQIPSAANGWVAKITITRKNWASTAVNPVVRLSWRAVRDKTVVGTDQSGNCSITGSSNCPTQWQCDANAPTTINGIAISAAEAAQMAPLFPGASSSCARASLHKVCSGTASMSSVISIADQIPAGVTAIRDFKVTVNNPQSGVAVVLTEAPTYANGWNAHFRVDRTNFSTQPAQPNITMTWGATVTTITTKVVDTGNCKDPGSTACPTRWSCDKSAPVVVNGILVTPEMAAKHSPLFPGAASTCSAGNLSRVCDGSSAVVSSIHIGHLLSSDSTSISDFAWKVNNPQSGITVELVEAPSLANGWVARFKATRDYRVATNPSKPSLTLNWNYLSELKVRTSIITTGDCDDIYGGIAAAGGPADASIRSMAAKASPRPEPAGSAFAGAPSTGRLEQLAQAVVDGLLPSANANPAIIAMLALAPSTCPVAWVCTKAAPGEANGIWVTGADLVQRGELYPSENLTCLNAEYRRTCQGAGSNRTVISIADIVPPDADTIANFGWHVIDPGAGVAIKLIQTPSKANGWKAIFETTRTDWNVKAEEPTVRLVWDQKGIPDWDVNTVDQGDCSVDGDEFCKSEWVCVEEYPDDPIPPTEATSSSITLNAPDAIGASSDHNFSIASQVPTGTAAIHDFRVASLTGTADVAVLVEPSKANGWQGTVRVTTTGYEYEYQGGKPLSRYARATFNFRWYLGERPAYVAPPYKSQSPGPLFPGDDGRCKRAEKHYTCERIWEGEVCFTDDDGEEMCVTQPETDTVPNDCERLEKDETCTQVREQCTEDGMSSSGHCYVSSKIFECKVTVVGKDVEYKEETTCSGSTATPCADGSCVQQETTTGSVSKSGADAVTMQTMLIDHDKPASPGGGGMAGLLRESPADRRTTGLIERAFQALVDGIIPSAAAQDAGSDPFGVPLPYPVPEEDPPGNPAEALGPGVAEDMMSKIKFFAGERESCKKMLGGLLDCCTKEPPDQQKAWWDRYRNFTRENGMAELSALPDESNSDGTGMWDNFDGSASVSTLSQPFTSIAENVSGGGSPELGSTTATLEDFAKQFSKYSTEKIKPSLGWYCKDHEKDLAIRKNLGQCTYLGSYCQNKSLLGVCIVKMHVSCCFNSPVTKLIRDNFAKQGMFQLGTAKHPSCGGIALTDLMKMNMENFDSSEVEARMAAGGFSPDIGELASLTGEEFDVRMFGSGNSLNDPTRKSLTERTTERLDGVDETLGEGYEAITNDVNSRSNTTNTDVEDPDSPGAITFNPGLYFVDEGKIANIKVSRNGGKGSVSVTLRSAGGSAVAGTDYTPVNTTLTWAAGEIGTKSVGVQTVNRSRTSTVTIGFALTNPTGGAIINPLTEATVEINKAQVEE